MKKSRRTLQREKIKKRRRRLLLIPVGLLLLALFGSVYVSSLLSLVEKPDQTGDPDLQESDIFNPEDYVTPTPPAASPPPRSTESNHTDTQVSLTTTTTTTTTTTEADQELLLEQAHAAALEGLPMLRDRQVYNLLLIGTDRRPGETTGRADAILILSVNRRNREIHIVSLMRALYVTIPGRTASMINAAYSWGGASLLIRTIEQNFRIPIDDYLVADFSGFRRAIDALGGVPVQLSQAEVDYLLARRPQAEIQPGVNHLNGDLALWYTRIRRIDSDFARTGRQRAVIATLIRQLGQLGPGELDQLARQVLPHIQSNRSGSGLLRLVADARSWRQYTVGQLIIPRNGTYEHIVVRRAQMVRYDVQANYDRLKATLYR